MLLRRGSDVEGRDVHQLRPHADVTLSDQNAGMVDRLGKTLLVYLRLETSFQQLLRRQLQDGIQLQFVVGKKSVSAHPTQQGGTLEDSFGVLGVQREESPCGLAELGKGVLDTPNFTLASEAVFTDQFQFSIQTFLFVWSTGRLEGLPV